MKVALICLLLVSNLSWSQNASTGEPISFSEIVNVDTSLKKTDLYRRAKTWFAEAYRSAQSVIQLEDIEEGKIIGKGVVGNSSGSIRYMITIQVKDGRYKYSIDNYSYEGVNNTKFNPITTAEECPYPIYMSTKKMRNKIWKLIKDSIYEDQKNLVSSLKKQMNAEPRKNDW